MKTKADPSGQSRNSKRVDKSLNRRLNNAERNIRNMVRSIPRTSRNVIDISGVVANRVVYDYELSPEETEQLQRDIQRELDIELLETRDDIMPPNWYYAKDIEIPVRQGTMEEVNESNRLIALAILSGILARGFFDQKINIQAFLLSPEYRLSLKTIIVENFGQIRSLSKKTAASVIQEINNGIKSNKSISEVGSLINQRFDVAKSSANRIAETEVNRAYNEAKTNTAKLVQKQADIKTGVIHISALTSTTRSHHAARHGNLYTVEAQNAWWNEGANRIHCKCTVKTVLIGKNNKLVDIETQERIQADKSFFE